MTLPEVSIVVTSFNRSEKLKRCVESLLDLHYPKYEIVVVNDGSKDDTKNMLENLKKSAKKLKVVSHKKNMGTGAGKKNGILNSKYNLVALIDDDCIVDKQWLKDLVKGFLENKKKCLGAVSSLGRYDGHSLIYNKKAVIEAGFFDRNFDKAFREDTDLAFRLEDLGYKIIRIKKGGKFIHNPPLPKTIAEKIKYGIHRIFVHSYDVLLYKKHPEKTKKFLDIKFGILRSPFKDFKNATGLWCSKFSFSSPQGVKLIENKSVFHEILIIFFGLVYASLVILARFYGSIKYKKLLL